eukprot:1048902-Pyramimonas_sp.AAC.1
MQTVLWVIAANDSQNVNIFTDCKTVIDICLGTATSTADRDLAMHLKLAYARASAIANIDLHRVPSREGMPWNELADGLSQREQNKREKNEPTNNVPRRF